MQLTENFIGYVTKDKQHFVVNDTAGRTAAVYKLGERAEFEDGRAAYSVSFTVSNEDNKYLVDLRRGE